MQNIPVFVVSLADAFERRAVMTKQLADLGIEFEFVEAVRGNALHPDERRRLNPAGNMSGGALGCYMSHVGIYERMRARSIPVALVLEDDAMLHVSVRLLVERGLRTLDFEYCFLGNEDRGDEGYVYYERGSTTQLTDRHECYRLSSGPYCTHAYLVTLRGAERRLECAFPARTAIDHYHYLPYKPDFRAVVPMIAFVNEQSAIGSMSSISWSNMQSSMRLHWWYYPLRDFVKLKSVRKMLARRRAVFESPGDWRTLESGVRVVRQARLKT